MRKKGVLLCLGNLVANSLDLKESIYYTFITHSAPLRPLSASYNVATQVEYFLIALKNEQFGLKKQSRCVKMNW